MLQSCVLSTENDIIMEIKTYTKKELALMYSPYATPAVASNKLARWIKRCLPLFKELQACHYHVSDKTLTPKQVALIVQYLGEP